LAQNNFQLTENTGCAQTLWHSGPGKSRADKHGKKYFNQLSTLITEKITRKPAMASQQSIDLVDRHVYEKMAQHE
jgi:hypothetical protein